MKLFRVTCVAAALGVATPTLAADLGGRVATRIDQTYPVEVYHPFKGLYWGLSAGYGWGDSEQMYDRNDNHGIASTSPSGGAASLTVGYNFPITSFFLLGLEADLGAMDISADDKIVYDGHVYKTQFGPWWGTMRGRAGIIVDRALLYATGGVAFMGVDEVSIGNTPGETAHNKDMRSGWVVGAGLEYALTTRMSAKVEYLHMDFGSYNGYSANREDFSFDNKVDLVRVGLNFKF